MKILLAPDSFKETLSSLEVIKCIEEVAVKHFSPLEIVRVPIADGGEGTVDSIITAAGGEYRYATVTGPLGSPVTAKYGIIRGRTAVIEMAQASGLPLVPPEERNPLVTTTYGTGELIKCVLDRGIREIIIGIGGSATNDGGIGAAQALGAHFLDGSGSESGFGGGELSRICSIDKGELDQRIKDCDITVICDVTNPLTGENGATMVYGPQKGASPEMLETLECGMKNYRDVLKIHTGLDIGSIPGSGAAGGLGAALVGLLGAKLKPGIDTILDLVEFDSLLDGVNLVITGEGRIDGQSVFGKVPAGVAKRCKQKNVRVAAIAGSMGAGAEKVYDCGLDSIMTTINRDMSIEEAMERSVELLKDAADRMFRFIKLGRSLG